MQPRCAPHLPIWPRRRTQIQKHAGTLPTLFSAPVASRSRWVLTLMMRAHKAGLMAGLMRSHAVQHWVLNLANAPLGAQLCRENWSLKGSMQRIGFSTLTSGVGLAVQILRGGACRARPRTAPPNSDLGFLWGPSAWGPAWVLLARAVPGTRPSRDRPRGRP